MDVPHSDPESPTLCRYRTHGVESPRAAVQSSAVAPQAPYKPRVEHEDVLRGDLYYEATLSGKQNSWLW